MVWIVKHEILVHTDIGVPEWHTIATTRTADPAVAANAAVATARHTTTLTKFKGKTYPISTRILVDWRADEDEEEPPTA